MLCYNVTKLDIPSDLETVWFGYDLSTLQYTHMLETWSPVWQWNMVELLRARAYCKVRDSLKVVLVGPWLVPFKVSYYESAVLALL